VADLDDVRRSPWDSGWPADDNARVALTVDGDAFVDRFNERLQRFVTATARS
jgi:hypothetical protein